jgi:hypothetical protein
MVNGIKMKVKLIKDHQEYMLINDERFVIATTDASILEATDKMKLSKQNCNLLFGIYEPISNEDWKIIDGFSDYKISHLGNVVSCKFGKTKFISQHIVKGGYNQVTLFADNGKKRLFRVHQLVAKEFLGHIINGMRSVIDHIDGNKKNNNVSNIRITSQRVNSIGRKNPSSKYKGVSFYKNYNKWCAKIYIDGKENNLGYFLNEEDAAKAYQDALSKIESKCHSLEIEVEIEMQCLDPTCDGINRKGICIPGDKPKLDSQGCLILKKI